MKTRTVSKGEQSSNNFMVVKIKSSTSVSCFMFHASASWFHHLFCMHFVEKWASGMMIPFLALTVGPTRPTYDTSFRFQFQVWLALFLFPGRDSMTCIHFMAWSASLQKKRVGQPIADPACPDLTLAWPSTIAIQEVYKCNTNERSG